MLISIVFTLTFFLNCCVYCISLCHMTLYPLTSLTYVHESPAHLYMPQLFTRCLPTIICVNDCYV